MNQYKISLIIPVYNVSKYLERCVESIVRQTFKDFEAIFVNDGSTDNSDEICRKLIHPYPHMRLVSKINGGLTSARLFGLNLSKGEYISFIDSDDYIHPNYLEKLYNSIIESDAEISICSYYTDNGESISLHHLYFPENLHILLRNEILWKYILPQIPSAVKTDNKLPAFIWMRLFRKSVLTNDVFVSEREVMLEDLALSLKIYKKINRISIVNTPLYYYCINPGSLTLRYRENVWEMLHRLYVIIQENIIESTDSIKRRKSGYLLNAIRYSLRMESTVSYQIFSKTLAKILSDQEVRNMFRNVNFTGLLPVYKLIYLMYWTCTSRLLYVLHKLK